MIGREKRFFKKTGRYKEIISTVVAFGFSDIVDQVPMLRKFRLVHAAVKEYRGKKLTEYSHNERLRMLLEALGPTFIKFGQILSNRHDILSKDLIKELSLLQSNVAPFDPDIAKEIVERSLGDKIENLFEYFEYESKFSASISQMHRARLLDGTEVAVKVQRPDIEDTIKLDIEILFDIASQVQKHVSSIAIFNPVGIVKSFKNQIMNELDFGYEKSNIKRFHKFFKDDNTVHIPIIYDKYCNKEILTMEYIDAVKISDINKDKYDFSSEIVLDRLANSMFRQIFYLNFFHADPHPGNLFVGDGNVISFIDFGMVGIITPSIKHTLSEMLYSIYNEDYTRFAKAILGLTNSKTVENFDDFNNTVYRFIQKYINLSIEEINLEDTFNEIITVINKYNLTLDADVTLMSKTAAILEGVCRKIEPDFVLMKKLRPLMKTYIKEQFSPKSILKQVQCSVYNLQEMITNLPKNLSSILAMVEDGTLEIKFNHKGIDELSAALDRAVNRLSYSIVLASMLIASALVVHAKIRPFVFGDIPIIGLVGFLLSAFMGFLLLFGHLIHYLRKK